MQYNTSSSDWVSKMLKRSEMKITYRVASIRSAFEKLFLQFHNEISFIWIVCMYEVYSGVTDDVAWILRQLFILEPVCIWSVVFLLMSTGS
jgi:hypothetical protein